MTIRRRNDCRLCHSEALTPVLALTPTPPANAFVTDHRQEQSCYPLTVNFCAECHHLQLREVLDPEVLFRHYLYVSGTSPHFVRHFARYADEICARLQLGSDDLVFEIGSNDGTLLRQFQRHDCRILGIDPAIEISRAASEAGVPTITGFFSAAKAEKIRDRHGQARAIVANNVLAHIDDLDDIIQGVRTLLTDDGLFAFEVSWFADVVEKTLFDTIYHEHLDYHTVAPLRRFFRRHRMELVAAIPQPTHGGSVRCLACHRHTNPTIEPSVEQAVARERALGLDRPETVRAFSERIDDTGEQLRQLLAKLTSEGKRIIAYGAPAKATTLMFHFDIGPPAIEAIIDDSPLKQGRYSPGKHLPIIDSAVLERDPPDYILILAWNFASAIMEKLTRFRAGGGKFIIPLPHLEIR